MRKVKDLKACAEKAWLRRRQYDGMLREIYDYVLPMRDVTGLWTPGGRAEADRRVDKVFDTTAVKAAFRFAGRLQTELTPVFQPFFSLEAGPLLPDDDNKKAITEELQRVGMIVNGVLSSGSFHQSAHEMYVDLYAGTGAMLILPGDAHDLVRFRVVPIPEIALEEGPYGDIWGVYWKRRWKVRELPVLWPKGRFSEQLKVEIKNNGEQDVEVCQYTYFDAEAKRWKLLVWCDRNGDGDEPFWDESFRTSPWITPRFFKVPGEPYGRGPAHLAMPSIKTTNKARELALKAAAFALMGLWMRRNDGVFNPDTVRFEPLAMWTVGATGGPLGATIQRLPVPQDFDVSSIVISDEREQMKQALFDDTLPPDAGAVRSATEIAERMRRLSQDLSGVFGRLTLEIVKPLVQRVIDILEGSGHLNTNITIDQLLTQVRVVAPIASGQQAAKMEGAVNWLQIMSMLAGPQAAAMAAKVEDLFPEMGRWAGVDERFIRGAGERQRLAQAAAQAAAVQAQQEQAATAPPPAAGADQLNGRPM